MAVAAAKERQRGGKEPTVCIEAIMLAEERGEERMLAQRYKCAWGFCTACEHMDERYG